MMKKKSTTETTTFAFSVIFDLYRFLQRVNRVLRPTEDDELEEDPPTDDEREEPPLREIQTEQAERDETEEEHQNVNF